MGEDRFGLLKAQLLLIFIGFVLACILIVSTTPIHEAAHWIMSDIDPFIEPIEIHLFDDPTFFNNQHILSSAFGYVIVKEKYPGAFKERSFWADVLQEIICVSIQIIITVTSTFKILMILKSKYIWIEPCKRKKKRGLFRL